MRKRLEKLSVWLTKPHLSSNMKLTNLETGLTFDDVLLLPGYADFKRREVDLSVRLHSKIKLYLPIISSPMDTVTEEKMAISMALYGGIGIIHRNLSPAKQAEMVMKVKQTSAKNIEDFVPSLDERGRLLVGAAVGVGSDFEKRLSLLLKAGVDLIVLDSGHGFTRFIIDAIKKVKKRNDVPVMAGNIATGEGARALVKAGADILRVGMGPGSICTTRVVTGMGVPQLTAVDKVITAVKDSNVTVVADGGIRQIGDMAKALAVGADAVMLGSLLSGFDESPGELLKLEGVMYKTYRGMGSISAMKKGGAERYGQKKATPADKLIAEGVEALVKYKGKVGKFLYQARGGLRSSFYYIGARNIEEFKKKAQFIKITESSLRESHPHTVKIVETGKSYLK